MSDRFGSIRMGVFLVIRPKIAALGFTPMLRKPESFRAAAIWLLIRQRRIWLLHIQQPELRRRALAAMAAYLRAVHYPLPRQARGRESEDDGPDQEADCSRIR